MGTYNPDQKRAYAAANREEIAVYQREYREKNHEKLSEYNKNYHAANKDRRRAYDKARRTPAPAKAPPSAEQVQARKVRKTLTTKARRYGISADALQDWYAAAWATQGGCCRVCNKAFSGSPVEFTEAGVRGPSREQAVIDHDHDTKSLRGLLCSSCNTFVGRIERDIQRAIAATDYILGHCQTQLGADWPE